MHYRREIDGLRAIAVLPVILFHAGVPGVPGGFFGVDIFFVISGYLITTIIIEQIGQGTFSILSFYERRARRILPALFLVVGVCIPAAWHWMTPLELRAFAGSVVSILFFSSNILFYREHGYFEAASELKPLLHTWSLAVEEQFYLFFPPVILLLARLGWRWTSIAVVGAAAVSLTLAAMFATTHPAAAFFLLPARAWELLAGAIVALALRRPMTATLLSAVPRPGREAMTLLGLALIAHAVLGYDPADPFPALTAAYPVAGACLVILFAAPAVAGAPSTFGARLLSVGPMVGIGLISYSLYLWHQPLLAFTRIATDTPLGLEVRLGLVAATIGLAYFTWRFVERPFRDAGKVPPPMIWRTAGALAGILLVASSIGVRTNGFESYYLKYRLDPTEAGIYADIQSTAKASLGAVRQDDGGCVFRMATLTPEFTERFDRCYQAHGPALMVVGDSHSQNVFNAMASVRFSDFIVGISKGGCRPLIMPEQCPYDAVEAFLAQRVGKVAHVLFHQSGAYLLVDWLGRSDSEELFIEGKPVGIQQQNIRNAKTYLSRLARYQPVTWLGPFPEARFDFTDLPRIASTGFVIDQHKIDIFSFLETNLKKDIAAAPQPFNYIPFSDVLQVDRNFLRRGNCITFRDQDHLSSCGEQILGLALLKEPEMQVLR